MHGLQIKGGLTLVVGDYLLDYVPSDREIEIHTVRHGRMLMKTPNVTPEEEDENDIDLPRP